MIMRIRRRPSSKTTTAAVFPLVAALLLLARDHGAVASVRGSRRDFKVRNAPNFMVFRTLKDHSH
jgi:hypothetical protein